MYATRKLVTTILCGLFTLLFTLPADAAVSLTVSNSSSTAPLQMCAGGTAGTFTATPGGEGSNTFTETQSPTVPSPYATLSPNTPQSSSKNAAITYQLTPKVATPNTGSQSITISLNSTPTATNATEFYTINGPLSVTAPTGSTPTLTFDGTAGISGTQSQTFTVSDPGPPINITATLQTAGIASFSPTSVLSSITQATANGTATFTVYPVGSSSGAAASTSISLSDTLGCPSSAPSSVTVKVIPGTLSLSTAALNFSALGTANNQTFTAQDYDFSGTLTATSSNASVATVSPASTPGPGGAKSVTYTVSPVGYGKSTLTVTDARSSPQVAVLVSGGTITAAGSPASFTATGVPTGNLAATPIRVTGSVETTSSGSANIYLQTPPNIIGSGGATLQIAWLSYDCTSNDATKNQGGAFVTTPIALAASSTSGNCLTFGNGGGTGQFANLDFNLNMFLNDQLVPADVYNTASPLNQHFTITLSAT